MKGNNISVLYAPSIASQFKASAGQLETGLMQLGFTRVYEVAQGADICASKEADEFTQRMKRGDKLMTTSCCSAYVRAVHIHVPDLDACVSETRSPMHYAAQLAKEENPACITVFIGPCLAKRREGFDDEFVEWGKYSYIVIPAGYHKFEIEGNNSLIYIFVALTNCIEASILGNILPLAN